MVQNDNSAVLFSGKAPKENTDRRIAIVGMSCLFPQAPDLVSFWHNIVGGVDCTRMVSENEWSTQRFYEPWRPGTGQQTFASSEDSLDQKQKQFEKIFCRRGGFITDIAEFDPLQFGVMPKAVDGSDPDQMLALKLACQAVADAGYNTRPFAADKAEVIIGRTAAPGQGAMNLIQNGQTVGQFIQLVSNLLPDLTSRQKDRLAEELRSSLHPCNPDTIVGVMPSVLAARIAGRLGFKGRSLVLDAACASSLIAVEMAVENLRSHRSDIALAGGVFVNSFAVFYQMFCGLGALSHTETIRPFDDNADGTLLGEGIGMVVLKRLDDAIRDGDKIYACITGVGSSSNGSGTSMLAPSSEGEALALQRAYDDAGISPTTVSLIEAHGTGTISGDLAEIQALEQVFIADSSELNNRHQCALGSVKSMIGHCQAASGIAGLIKAALSLYHRVLPATINVRKPISQIDWDDSFFYLNTKTRPWIHPKLHPRLKALVPDSVNSTAPRRAAVSAFGFGGVNAHTVLEEYDDVDEARQESYLHDWETEVFSFIGRDRAQLLEQLSTYTFVLSQSEKTKLKDLAYSINTLSNRSQNQLSSVHTPGQNAHGDQFERLAIVASSIQDLINKIAIAQNALNHLDSFYANIEPGKARDIYFSQNDKVKSGKLAFILPGLGAAYPNMLSELCIHFPDVRAIFDFVDQLSASSGANVHLSDKIFPPPKLTGSNETSASLATMDAAVVTVLMAEWALFTLLLNLGVMPDLLLGCSTGEFAALTMGGATDIISAASVFYHLSTTVANSIPKEKLAQLRSIMVVAPYATIQEYTNKYSSIYLSADLSAKQVILSGTKNSIEELVKELEEAGIEVHMLPAAIPYHTPLVEGVIETDQEDLSKLEITTPTIPAWSCSSASSYPDDAEAIREITTRLFTKPILFKRSIEALYADGVTKFIEVGPKDTLSSVVSEILAVEPHIAVPCNRATGSALTQLNHLLAVLYANGVQLNLDYLYQRRKPQLIDFSQANALQTKPRVSSMKLDLSYPGLKLQPGWQERTGIAEYKTSVSNGHSNDIAVTGLNAARYKQSPPGVGSGQYVQKPDQGEKQVSESEDVLSSYFQSLSQFHGNLMRTQQEVMLSYLAQDGEAPREVDTIDELRLSSQIFAPPTSHRENVTGNQVLTNNNFPLLAGACFSTWQNGLAVDLVMTLDQHKYLLDHAIGGITRSQTHSKEKVYLLPLTVAIELMAEAASFLCPDLKVLAVNNVRAYKRIRVTTEGLALKILAAPYATTVHTINVSICRSSNDSSNDSSDANYVTEPLMSCEIIFGNQYAPAPLVPSDLSTVSQFHEPDTDTSVWRRPRLVPAKLYGQDAMFHGPTMQSVISIDAVAERRIVGKIRARDPEHWFDSSNGHGVSRQSFLLDPLLLDNATQLVLFHLFEHDEPVNALLPFLIQSLRFYDNLGTVSGDITIRAKLNSMTPRGTEADVYVCNEDGRIIAEFESINSRRIILDNPWQSFVFRSDSDYLSRDLRLSDTEKGLESVLRSTRHSSSDVVLRTISDVFLPADEGTLSWCADYVLAPVEIQHYDSLTALARKREWLLGRIAAKESVRQLANRLFSTGLCSADVVIFTNDDGKPFVGNIVVNGNHWQPCISISHKDGIAIALAVSPDSAQAVGIDLETISPREQGFESLVLTEQERSRFNNKLTTERDIFLAEAWSAKEAAGKALGTGLAANPQNFEITDFDAPSRTSALRLNMDNRTNSIRSHFSKPSDNVKKTFAAHHLQLANQILSIVFIN